MFKVSVIIPVYNRAKLIKEAVESALNFEQVGEVLIVDDGSTDGSLEICKEISQQEKRVKIFRHPNGNNKGVSASRNLGIKNARFEYISFLDSDDFYHKNRFELDEKVFEENPEASVVYSLSQIQFENGNTESFGTNKNLLREVNNNRNEFYRYVLEKEIMLGHISSVTFKKTVFYKIPKWFDTRLSLHEDTEFWNRVARKYPFYSGQLSISVSTYTHHTGNTISKRSKDSEIKLLVVFIDNVGIHHLWDFEKNYIIYHLARAISNPIRPHWIRKTILHGVQIVLIPVKNVFTRYFYHWGMRHLKL